MFTRRYRRIPTLKINPYFPRFFTNTEVNQNITNFGIMKNVNQTSNVNQVFQHQKFNIEDI